MTTSNRPNLDALGSALNIYRDVMREMIVSILSAAYGEDLTRVVVRALRGRGRDDTASRIDGGAPVEDTIDVNDYSALVGHEWDEFRQLFSHDRRVITRMRLIGDARNQYAHPPRGDLAAHGVMARLSDMADLIDGVGATHGADAVRDLLGEVTVRVAAEEEARVARLEAERQQEAARQEEAARLETERRREEEIERRAAEIRERRESATDSTDEQLIELRARLEVFQGATEAETARLQETHERTEATLEELRSVTGEGRADQERIGGRVAELARVQADTGGRVDSLEARVASRSGSSWSRTLLLFVFGIVVAAVAQAAGFVDLAEWPPQQGSFFGVGVEDTAATPESYSPVPGSATTDVVPKAPADSTSSITPAVPNDSAETLRSLLLGTEPDSVVIMNTGADGMSPGGDGVAHYRKCVADDHFLASDMRWPDGTKVELDEQALEDRPPECWSWLLLQIGEHTSWVPEEYVFVRNADQDGLMVFDTPIPHRYFADVDGASLRLAVFVDSSGNAHWMVVEDLGPDTKHNGYHQTGFRGKTATDFSVTSHYYDLRRWVRGAAAGLSWIALDVHGKIVGIGAAGPEQIKHARIDKTYARVLTTRLGWFNGRGIEVGSYVEFFDLPVRVSTDGVPQ